MIKLLNTPEKLSVKDVGGKAHSLNVLLNNNIYVPHGIIIPSDDFIRCLKQNNIYEHIAYVCDNIANGNIAKASTQLKKYIHMCNFSSELLHELTKKVYVFKDSYVSVRSSAVSEDNRKHTFAGIHDSYLNIAPDVNSIVCAIKKCWASLFNERSFVYRKRKGLPLFEGMAVIVQNMVQAKCSGVAYTRHPVDDSCILIEASYGIGDSVVRGVVRPDEILVKRDCYTVLSKTIGTKKTYTALKKGIHSSQTQSSANANKLSIDEPSILELAKVCSHIEELFKVTQDIEWAYDDKLWILQSRAVNF